MTRSTWKGPFYEEYLLKKADDVRKSGKTKQVIKIWTRRSTILPEFVGLTFGVYNGNKFIPVSVNENMVGHKFGEFSPTRNFQSHSAVSKSEAKTISTAPGASAPGASAPGASAPGASSAPAATPSDKPAPEKSTDDKPKEESKGEKK